MITRSELSCALALGVSIGFADACTALLSTGHELDELSALAPGVLALAAAFFAAFVALILVTRIALRRLEPDPAGVAAAIGLLLVFVLVLMERPIELHVSSEAGRGASPGLQRAALVAALASVALLAALGAYAVAWFLRRRPVLEAAARAMLVVPALLAELTLALWAVRARPALRLRVVALLFLAAAVATVLLAWGRGGRLRAKRLLLGTSAALVLAAASSSLAGASRDESAHGGRHTVRRVVLITVDTLRVDALGCYGGATKTPALDRYAADSVLFREAISPAPWTLPSLASMLTGVAPAVHDFHLYMRSTPGRGAESRRRIPTLAERTRDAGYRTAAFVANAIVLPGTNITRGFHEYALTPSRVEPRSVGGRLLRRPTPGLLPPVKSGRVLTAEVERWLAKNANEDFFLWVHYFDPHLPYRVPPELLPKTPRPPRVDPDAVVPSTVRDEAELAWLRAMYDAEVRLTDESVGRLLETMRRLGLYEDALVVFTSDHGEGFLEHGLMGHSNNLYQEVLHVPLVVKLPGRRATARVVETPVDTTSITPTVLDFCGIPWTGPSMSSPSLKALFQDPAPSVWPPIVSTGVSPNQEKESVLMDQHKYIRASVTGDEELYDLVKDPGEKTSLAAASPGALAAARAAIAAHREAAARLRDRVPAAKGTTEADRETVSRLKALGYIQ